MSKITFTTRGGDYTSPLFASFEDAMTFLAGWRAGMEHAGREPGPVTIRAATPEEITAGLRAAVEAAERSLARATGDAQFHGSDPMDGAEVTTAKERLATAERALRVHLDAIAPMVPTLAPGDRYCECGAVVPFGQMCWSGCDDRAREWTGG